MHIDKCDQKGIDVTVDNVMYIPDNMETQDVKGKFINFFCVFILMKLVLTVNCLFTDDVSSVIANLHHVRLDHDYTPLTSPKRSSSSAEDDDELGKITPIFYSH